MPPDTAATKSCQCVDKNLTLPQWYFLQVKKNVFCIIPRKSTRSRAAMAQRRKRVKQGNYSAPGGHPHRRACTWWLCGAGFEAGQARSEFEKQVFHIVLRLQVEPLAQPLPGFVNAVGRYAEGGGELVGGQVQP